MWNKDAELKNLTHKELNGYLIFLSYNSEITHPHPSVLKNWPQGRSLPKFSGTERQAVALVLKAFPTNWRQSKNKTDGLDMSLK